MNYKKTLKNSIDRISKFVDEKVEFYNKIPLFNWIEISPIDACNRKCVFCPKSDSKIAPDTYNVMDNKHIEKLAKELKSINYTGTIVFAGYGEPILDKSIFEKISILSKICNVEITTNGDPLNKKNLIRLMESGISKIVVSLYDGPEQIEKFNKLFISAGIDEKKYVLRDRWYKEDEGWGLMVTNRAGTLDIENKNLPQKDDGYGLMVTNKASALVQENRNLPLKKDMSCYYAHYSMMIDWNGNCYLCPHDWQRKMIAGNITNQNIIDIWNSEILKKYRTNLGEGKRVDDPCKKCNAFGLMHGLKHHNAWKKYYNC